MADFNLAVTAPSLVVEAFDDPPRKELIDTDGDHVPDTLVDVAPSRLNHKPGLPHLRRRVDVDETVTLTAEVGGVSAPDDVDLDDRFFAAWVAEQPGLGDAGTIQIHAQQPDLAKSSVQTFRLRYAGHYTLVMKREGGGGHIVHIDAVA